MAKFILDTRLSADHYVLCTEAIRCGIIRPDDLNEGRRTIPEQWAFYRNQPPLAAFPQPNAPHIWLGRNNHAIDSNSWNGAAQRLAHFYEAKGVHVVFNVPGENWHFQPTSGTQLKNAANRIRRERDRQVSVFGETEPRIGFFKFQLHFIKDRDTHKTYFKPGEKKPEGGWGDHFSEDLRAAVKKFQRDHHLGDDGKIGPATDRKIDRAYSRAKRHRKSAKLRAQERKAKVQRGEKL